MAVDPLKAAYNKKYKEKHKERLQKLYKEYHKKYYQANKDKLKAKRNEYYKKHPNRLKRIMKKYRENHKETWTKRLKAWRDKNKDRVKAKRREWYLKNKDHVRDYNREYDRKKQKHRKYVVEYTEKNREMIQKKANEWHIKKKYDLSIDDYNKMFEKQAGVCCICKQPETKIHNISGKVQRLSLDHSHTTGVNRGLLCSRCNIILGVVAKNDTVELLQSCIDYLNQHGSSKGTIINGSTTNNIAPVSDNVGLVDNDIGGSK